MPTTIFPGTPVVNVPPLDVSGLGGTKIKSIQTGFAEYVGGGADITIATVNPAKSIAYVGPSVAVAYNHTGTEFVRVTGPNTLRQEMITNWYPYHTRYIWTVIEYE